MAQGDKGRMGIKLKASICTDNPTGTDIYRPGAEDAQHVENTGIERQGGLTPIYEQETTFPTAGLQSLITKSGDTVQVDSSHNVRINDVVIGNVGPYAVSSRGALKGYSDAAWTAGNTIIGIVKVGSTIRVDEISPSTGEVLNTRSTTFTMPAVAVTNVILVKYMAMNFADSLTFILSNNVIAYALIEASAPNVSVVGGTLFTSRTSASARQWFSVCWSPQLNLFCAVARDGLVATQVMTSPDGVTWTSRTSASARQWTSICWSPQLGLFCAVAVDGLVATQIMTSPDGITWTSRTSASGRQWTSVCWSPQLNLFCAVAYDGIASTQVMTSPNGTAWTSQTSSSARQWATVCWSTQLNLFCAVAQGGGVAGQVMTSPDGVTWTSQNSANDRGWTSVCWSPQLNLFCAVANDGVVAQQVMTSPDGTAWTARTSSSAQTWGSIAWSPQLGLFCAIGGTAGTQVMTSSDGITWTAGASASVQGWTSVCWSPQLNLFCGVAIDGAVGVQVMTSSQIVLKTNIAWKFAANKYIVGAQGVGVFSIGDIVATMTAITDATWCVIDQFVGTAFSRAILTFNVKKNSANLLTGIGEVGYNQSGTYSATPTYYGVALAAVTVTITNNISGPGYAEATFTRSDSGTNIYYYQAPVMQHVPGLWYDYAQSQTQTLCNGYGRLTDFNGNTKGNTCSLRVVMISGQPSLLSAGVIGQEGIYDYLGVPVTNNGEFDETFMPSVVDNGSTLVSCIYRNGGVLFFFVITSGATNTIQAVSDNLYMVNCLSPANAIDIQKKSLALGANDYNGRILFRSTAAIIATVQIAGVMQGANVNSIDPGVKLITQTFSTITSPVPGIEIPSFVDRAIPDYGVNIYLSTVADPANPTYSVSYQSFNITFTKGDLSGVTHVNDTRIPFAMGYVFGAKIMQTEIETIFAGVGVTGSADINYDYLCYELGNETPGVYQSFVLYAQTFLFDGLNIWLSTFNGSLFGGKGNAPIATATGMVLIAAAPTVVYFFSLFDNSIYLFDGGRTLSKMHRLNDIRNSSGALEPVLNGVYNVRDSTLLMQTASTFVWVRDNIISQTYKNAAQIAASDLFDTDDGIQIANTMQKWIYSFFALSASTVVPFVFKSAYFGLLNNMLMVNSMFDIAVYSPDKTQTQLTLSCDSIGEDGTATQTRYITIKPADWSSLGLFRCRIRPKTTKVIAVSFGLQCLSKIVLTEAIMEWTEDVPAVPANDRSV